MTILTSYIKVKSIYVLKEHELVLTNTYSKHMT